MTRKDFQLIADVLNAHADKPVDHDAVLKDLAHDFARALAETNPRFDQQRFVMACLEKS